MSKILNFLADNNLRQVDISNYLGISKASVSSWVAGRTKPDPVNLHKLVNNNMGWDVSALTDGTTNIPPLADTAVSQDAYIRLLQDMVESLRRQNSEYYATIQELLKKIPNA